MLTIGIVDDSVGIFSTYYKLRQVVCADFICMVLNEEFPLCKLSAAQVYGVGAKAVKKLNDLKCDVIVLSSSALSPFCRRFSVFSSAALYACEAPILHASTYTASRVLVCGEAALQKQTFPNVIYCPMEEFPVIAQSGQERRLVDYVEQRLRDYIGKFDCIALASSSMNLYKNCFNRVCPNVRIFDSLDGVARKIRKKYKKTARDEENCSVINAQGENIGEKYAIFLE